MWVFSKTTAINIESLVFIQVSSVKYIDRFFYVKGALPQHLDAKDYLTIAGAFSKEMDASRVFNRIMDGIRENSAFIEVDELKSENE